MKIDFLYKYKAIDAKMLRILVCNDIYFAPPDSFNDPFDCNLLPSLQITKEEVYDFVKQQFPDIPENKLKEVVDNNTEKYTIDLYKSLENELAKIRKSLTVSCFSEVNNSSLMYSHYADGHKGLCLEFKVIDNSFYDVLFPVQYPDNYPAVRFFKHDLQVMMDSQLLTKQPEWRYEKEWRIIKVDNPNNYQKFPLEILTGIIFGLRTSDADITMIKELTKHRVPNLKYYKCVKPKDSYYLNIDQI